MGDNPRKRAPNINDPGGVEREKTAVNIDCSTLSGLPSAGMGSVGYHPRLFTLHPFGMSCRTYDVILESIYEGQSSFFVPAFRGNEAKACYNRLVDSREGYK